MRKDRSNPIGYNKMFVNEHRYIKFHFIANMLKSGHVKKSYIPQLICQSKCVIRAMI